MNLVHFVFIIFLFQALKEIYYAFAEDLLPEPGVCGRGMPTDRIVGGRAAALGEFPWMALIQYSKPQNQIGFHCGGALVNERYVLTASHCIIGQNVPLTWEVTNVRLGEYDFLSKHDCVGEECLDPDEVKNVNIEEIITHNGYDPTNRNQLNDIALLRLAEKVNYTRFISPICLPRSDNLKNLNITGHVMDVAGWGLNSTGSQSTILQKTYLKVDSLDKCKIVYKMKGYTLEKTQICAGGEEGIDTCRGDSGGPLVGRDFHQYPNGRKMPFFYAAGIISFGTHGCGLPNWPGVYTKVSDYIDWIEENIKP